MSDEGIIGPQSCFYCGGEYGAHDPDCRLITGPNTWYIEYEIPPLRAIYRAEMQNLTMDEVKEVIAKEQPLWRIRKLTRK